MAEEQIGATATTQETAAHVHDYGRFTKMMKWGTIVAAITALLVLLIIS